MAVQKAKISKRKKASAKQRYREKTGAGSLKEKTISGHDDVPHNKSAKTICTVNGLTSGNASVQKKVRAPVWKMRIFTGSSQQSAVQVKQVKTKNWGGQIPKPDFEEDGTSDNPPKL